MSFYLFFSVLAVLFVVILIVMGKDRAKIRSELRKFQDRNHLLLQQGQDMLLETTRGDFVIIMGIDEFPLRVARIQKPSNLYLFRAELQDPNGPKMSIGEYSPELLDFIRIVKKTDEEYPRFAAFFTR
jgi:hypothetical protein